MRARWGLVLLAAASAQTPPPPPPVHPPPHPAPLLPCTWSPPDRPEIVYNLTTLEKHFATDPVDLMVHGPLGGNATNGTNATASFFASVCNPSHARCSHTKCVTCSPTIVPPGIMHWSATKGDTCAALGSISTAKWALQDSLEPAGGVQISYVGGDSGHSVTFLHVCDPAMDGPGLPLAKATKATPDPKRKGHYIISVSSVAACPIMPKPLSWGWLSIIFGTLIACGYVGGGVAYNRRNGLEGVEALPQREMWAELPGLVRDGCRFSWRHAKVYGRAAYAHYQEVRDPGRRELREPIAAVADEGEAAAAAPAGSGLPWDGPPEQAPWSGRVKAPWDRTTPIG